MSPAEKVRPCASSMSKEDFEKLYRVWDATASAAEKALSVRRATVSAPISAPSGIEEMANRAISEARKSTVAARTLRRTLYESAKRRDEELANAVKVSYHNGRAISWPRPARLS